MTVQINFSLRASANAETVHLLGNWDSYRGQLPLSRDKSAKPGSWTGTFRFQQSMVQPGKRYWYYYIINGYHVSHDPAAEFTVEPTTKRKLNILDIPNGAPDSRTSPRSSHTRAQSGTNQNVVLGRGISPSRIAHPRPSKPYASRRLREEYDLSKHMEHAMSFSPSSDSDSGLSSPASLWSSRTGSSSPSSLSELSDSSSGSSSSHCSCNRYGITRRGERVKIDCGGMKCSRGVDKSGYARYDNSASTPFDDESDSCSSESDEEYRRVAVRARRQGISVRR